MATNDRQFSTQISQGGDGDAVDERLTGFYDKLEGLDTAGVQAGYDDLMAQFQTEMRDVDQRFTGLYDEIRAGYESEKIYRPV